MRFRTRAVLIIIAGLFGTLFLVAGPASAAARYSGGIDRAYQYRDGNTVVHGWVYDRTAPSKSVWMCLWSGGECRKTVHANLRGSHGQHHAFSAVLPGRDVGTWVTLRRMPQAWVIASRSVSSPGTRVAAIAARQVGGRYVWGGSTPSGFDCSGLAMYSYRHAGVASLPHQSERQRWAPHMHKITQAQARRGDLIFYLSGGSAYHVAIYAGHDWQYSASTPATGIRYQQVWGSNIEFRTDWH